ncbi:uncharacterized protein B0I36DRAFT_74036 [Microdochium trichocladiopsis]|uniref:F-box domain-containing protein n=1 Tax=Microdochium trichocladiopsis TaxID=1682393 RepID=A0A9P8YET8_9PEZI|nr:uncharacterized protein B0I36DRAFT_74036 [Microdochium trichocladiopsis]KAH7038013.1 hypothetical protein B0I36DRAFT_74036 [Microdochium trichocladiopsis]
MAATSKLETLPRELFDTVYRSVTRHADRLALSSASTSLRRRLAPQLFRAVKLGSDPDAQWRGLGVLLAAGTPTAQFIRHSVEVVYFAGSADGLVLKKDWKPSVPVLPEPCWQVLAGEVFLRATTVHVKFDFGGFEERTYRDGDDESGGGGGGGGAVGTEPWEHDSEFWGSGSNDVGSIYVYEKPETSEQVVRAKEERYPWRSLMRDVWSALAENTAVKKLVVEDAVPKPTSTFYSPAWVSFLGGLQELEVSMMTGDNGAGWEANTLDGYLYFECVQLRDLFFRHCTNLARLRLVAGPRSSFGGGGEIDASGDPQFGWCEGPLPLDEADLPNLERLELKNMFISKKLAEFIVGKGRRRENEEGMPREQVGRLRSVLLLNCHVNTGEANMASWEEFFEMLVGTSARDAGDGHASRSESWPKHHQRRHNLDELDISYRYGSETIPLVHRHEDAPVCFIHDRHGQVNPSEVPVLQLLAMRDPNRRAFSYASPSGKYGDVWMDTGEVVERFAARGDEAAYFRLMQTVQDNKRAVLASCSVNS